jgi:outer membrane protein TolC
MRGNLHSPSVIVFSLAVALGLAAAPPGPRGAVAATPPAVAANPDSALAATLAGLPGEQLSLAGGIAEALAQGSALQLAAAQRAAAAGAARRERGAFWPELFGEVSTSGDEQPTASVFAGAELLETETRTLSGGARLRLPTGTELSASLNTLRTTSNSDFSLLSPQIDSYGELALTQPLLKGFGPAARGELDASRELGLQAEALYADARLSVIAELEATYWALYAAERDYGVQLLIAEQARAFLGEVELRAEAGLNSAGAVASARVFLAQQGQAVLDGEEQLDRVSDRLATLIGRRPQVAARFRATAEPPAAFPAIGEEELVALAGERNLVLAAEAKAVAAARARSRAASWDALPQLDLFGALGGRGLGGRGREVIVDFGSGPDTLRSALDTGFSDTFDQVTGRDYATWRWGLRLNVPLGGRDRGERDRLRADEARAEAQLLAARRALAETVRAQYRELSRGETRLALAADGVAASLEQVRIGRAEFTSGRTTAFELVRLAADLADAQRRYSAALFRRARAAAELRRLTGGAYPGPVPASTVTEESAP